MRTRCLAGPFAGPATTTRRTGPPGRQRRRTRFLFRLVVPVGRGLVHRRVPARTIPPVLGSAIRGSPSCGSAIRSAPPGSRAVRGSPSSRGAVGGSSPPCRRSLRGVPSRRPGVREAPALAARTGVACGRRRDSRSGGRSTRGLRTAPPERGLDSLRVVRIWRYHADPCAGSGDGGRAGPGGPYRQARIAGCLIRHPPPPLFPLKDVPLTGADVGGENWQGRQAGAVLRFLEDVAGVMGPGREFVVPDRSPVAQRAEIGKESRLIVAWSG